MPSLTSRPYKAETEEHAGLGGGAGGKRPFERCCEMWVSCFFVVVELRELGPHFLLPGRKCASRVLTPGRTATAVTVTVTRLSACL